MNPNSCIFPNLEKHENYNCDICSSWLAATFYQNVCLIACTPFTKIIYIYWSPHSPIALEQFLRAIWGCLQTIVLSNPKIKLKLIAFMLYILLWCLFSPQRKLGLNSQKQLAETMIRAISDPSITAPSHLSFTSPEVPVFFPLLHTALAALISSSDTICRLFSVILIPRKSNREKYINFLNSLTLTFGSGTWILKWIPFPNQLGLFGCYWLKFQPELYFFHVF